jgi:hypothetical protein
VISKITIAVKRIGMHTHFYSCNVQSFLAWGALRNLNQMMGVIFFVTSFNFVVLPPQQAGCVTATILLLLLSKNMLHIPVMLTKSSPKQKDVLFITLQMVLFVLIKQINSIKS